VAIVPVNEPYKEDESVEAILSPVSDSGAGNAASNASSAASLSSSSSSRQDRLLVRPPMDWETKSSVLSVSRLASSLSVLSHSLQFTQYFY
jgi:hypothetical protein